MWTDTTGSNFTTDQVAEIVARRTGVSYTPRLLESTYRVGAIYRNGSVWFQRLS